MPLSFSMKSVYAVCDRIMRNNAIAEELTQGVFVQVLRKIDTFRGESQFYTWLHSIAVNAAVMYLRKHRLPMESLCDTSESGEPACEAVVDWDSQLLGTVDRLWIQRAIASLPAGSRSVFILHDVQGYGHRGISAMLGCSVGSTKAQLHRARFRLRSMLQMNGRLRRCPHDEGATCRVACDWEYPNHQRAAAHPALRKVPRHVSPTSKLRRSGGHFSRLAAVQRRTKTDLWQGK